MKLIFLFLDVEMPGNSGFQLMDQLMYMPQIVLTSAKTDYAFEAFQYNVADYLKKPFTYSRFLEAVGKVTETPANGKATNNTGRYLY